MAVPREIVRVVALSFSLAACSGNNLLNSEEMAAAARSELLPAAREFEIRVVEIDLSRGLSDALPGAVDASSAYRASLSREAEAEAAAESARGSLRPSVAVSGTGGSIRESSTPRTAASTTTGVAAQLDISQLLYDGGASVSRVNAATARVLSARAERERVGNEVAVEASRAWAQLWLAQQRERLLSSKMAEMRELVGQLERMAASGIMDRAALDEVRSTMIDMDVEASNLTQARVSAETAFRRYFKALPEGAIRLGSFMPVSTLKSEAQDWQSSPALFVAAAELLAARAGLDQSRAAYQPSARLRSGISSPMQEDDSTDTTLGVTFQYNIYRGGSRHADVQAAEARLSAADAALDEASDTIRSEVQGLLAQLEAVVDRARMVSEQAALHKERAAAVRSQISTGQANLGELLRSELASFRALDTELRLSAERQILEASIRGILGGLL